MTTKHFLNETLQLDGTFGATSLFCCHNDKIETMRSLGFLHLEITI